jgi:hypothetical protein
MVEPPQHDKESDSSRLETELLNALDSVYFELSRDELKSQSLVELLRQKLARRRS